uniref:R3H domain-containing protein n=1 Tax=Steinernema glaseri TaxID=37863 RepID=A0A1I7YII6_9BILA
MVDSDLDMYLDSTADRVASVTLESDSFPETPDIQRTKYKRRRKVVKKARQPAHSSSNARYEDNGGLMDVDVDGQYSEDHGLASGSKMDWERDAALESELSSHSDGTDGYSDADDEQSDDEPSAMSKRPETTFERKACSLHGTAAFGCATPRTIMRRLERFVRDDSQSEIEIPCLSKPHELRRLIQHLGLEKSNRHRGTIILRKTK